MTVQLEDRLATDLRDLPVTTSAAASFVDGVVAEASARQRRQGVLHMAAVGLLVMVLGVGVWLNGPATVPTTTDGASTAAQANPTPVEPSPYRITDAQDAQGGWANALEIAAWGLLPRLVLLMVLVVAAAWAIGTYRRARGLSRWRWRPLRWMALGFVTLLGAWLWSFDVFFIPSESMSPTLPLESRVIVNPHDTSPEIGDIVVLDRLGPPRSPHINTFIKRVVGTGGDVLEAPDGELLINGDPLQEWLRKGPLSDFGPVEIPDDHVFVIGDNVSGSIDSRAVGPIPIDAVSGTVVWHTRTLPLFTGPVG